MTSSSECQRPRSMLFPYTTLFRSLNLGRRHILGATLTGTLFTGTLSHNQQYVLSLTAAEPVPNSIPRSEEHTSELQSPMYLVCRLLLEKKNMTIEYAYRPRLHRAN